MHFAERVLPGQQTGQCNNFLAKLDPANSTVEAGTAVYAKFSPIAFPS